MRDGFIKIAAATPDLHVADCAYNTSEIVKLAKEAAAKGAKLITFPELCLTGYTCGDLFLQETLLEGALDALNTVCRETAELAAVIVVGLPLRVRGKLYNVAAVVNAGDVLAFVPKTHLPNYSEFYEQRHFVSADTLSGGMEGVDVKNADGEAICVPLVTDSIFQCDEQPLFTFGVEICEDLWVPNPPSTALAQMGAHIIVNLSASDEIIGKAGYRRDLVRQQSGRLLCAYLYADAGFGESTQPRFCGPRPHRGERRTAVREQDVLAGHHLRGYRPPAPCTRASAHEHIRVYRGRRVLVLARAGGK